MSQDLDTTYRSKVSLPDMPTDEELADRYPPLDLHRASLVNDQLVFDQSDGFDASVSRGFFLLRIPSDIDLVPADRFADHYYEDPAGDQLDQYRGFRDVTVPGDYQGYFPREHDQWENFYIERQNWPLLPAGVDTTGEKMARAGISVLRSVLDHVEVPSEMWDEVTGGLTAGGGHRMLAFNHFRPDRTVRGSKFHRDSGWVTVLRSTEPGLLALIGDDLRSILPEPGYFIVNFGSSLEVLTENMPRPVRANIHGVASTTRRPDEPHRTSYVTFLDSRLDGMIYRADGQTVRAVQTVAEFANQEVTRTYDEKAEL